MNNNNSDNTNTAFEYYPKAITLGEQNEKIAEQEAQPRSNPFSMPSFNFSPENNPLFAQLLGGNPLLSSLLSSGASQENMLSKLMSSLMQKPTAKDDFKEKVIDISNSVQEL